MSLSRLPQVALRRLVPAITAVPKSMDDDQLKKMLEPQQASLTSKSLLSKSDTTALPYGATQQGLISTLAKSVSANSSSAVPPAIGRLLVHLSGGKGMLSSQDLALIRAVSNGGATSSPHQQHNAATDAQSLLTTPEPGSPMEGILLADQEPNTGALDAESVESLVSALRGTAAISSENSSVDETVVDNTLAASQSAVKVSEQQSSPRRQSVKIEDDGVEFSDEDDHHPISADLSAAERRKEQNRRAQKKFRQKDKVRQKEIKWRASQYESLVESNKRFKRDIDSITRERDLYRQILKRSGIKIDEDTQPVSTDAVKQVAIPTALETATAATNSSGSVSTSSLQSPQLLETSLPLGMDQIAQDTFGTLANSSFSQANAAMSELLSGLAFGAVKSDPMFGTDSLNMAAARGYHSLATGSADDVSSASVGGLVQSMSSDVVNSNNGFYSAASASNSRAQTNSAQNGNLWFDSLPSSADPLLVESPMIVDHNSMDHQYAQAMIDSQFVDPMAFIDELLASPNFASNSLSPAMPSVSSSATAAVTSVSDPSSRKRSFDDAMF
ncbi:hypothetical protein H4S08_002934 [Coemansia sp. RSA 1365]|nr:hypothetical protein H4S08_002934 [Coemansia sp. RSA 1365]